MLKYNTQHFNIQLLYRSKLMRLNGVTKEMTTTGPTKLHIRLVSSEIQQLNEQQYISKYV